MNKAAGWTTGVLTLLALSALALRFYVPPLPGTLALGVEFASAPESPTEPLFVTGRTDDGDFIFVKYLDPTTVVFGYDRWGAGGPVSAPINVRPGTRHALVIASPSAAQVRGSAVRGPERLRVTFDGAVVLDTAGRFELRRASRAWLAENPLGGSSCGSTSAAGSCSASCWRASARAGPRRGWRALAACRCCNSLPSIARDRTGGSSPRRRRASSPSVG